MSYSHFQTVYIDVLAELLQEITLPLNDGNYKAAVAAQLDKVLRRYGLYAQDDQHIALECLAKEIVKEHDVGELVEKIAEAVRTAHELANKRILAAPYLILDDNGQASELVKAFVADDKQRSLMFTIHGSYTHHGFAFFKLPYNDNIEFLYGALFQSYALPVFPHQDMKYAGFYSKATGKAYGLLEPLDGLYWLHREYPREESEDMLYASLLKDIQQEVSHRIREMAEKDAAPINLSQVPGLLEQVQAEYGKGFKDFADSIEINKLILHTDDLVQYIDNPGPLIKVRADEYLKNNLADLRRRWDIHRSVQKLMEQMPPTGQQTGSEQAGEPDSV